MAKGSSFERELCKDLSEWWTRDRRDDVFWRTAGSGARATTRGKRGRKTAGAAGDVCATDPIGDPFTRLITLELKRGYNAAHLHALLDRAPHAATQLYEDWLAQAERSAKNAGTPYWWLVHRRDLREAVLTMPLELAAQLNLSGGTGKVIGSCCETIFCDKSGNVWRTYSCLLTCFFQGVSPDAVRAVAEAETQGQRR